MFTKKRNAKTALILALSLLITALPGCAPSEDASQSAALSTSNTHQTQTLTQSVSGLEPSYRIVKESYTLPEYTGEPISLLAVEAVLGEADIELDPPASEQPALRITQGDTVTLQLQVPVDGVYGLSFLYYETTDNIIPVAMAIQIDGSYPFYEMRSQQFGSRWYYDGEEFPKDRYGNEVVPQSEKIYEWRQVSLRDSSALTDEALLLELTQGVHEITLTCEQSELLLSSISLMPVEKKQYSDEGDPAGDAFYPIEAECFSWKNESAIRPAAEYNPDLTPYSSKKAVLNYLAGDSFATGGQEVTYQVTVGEDGYYAIAFRYRQNYKADFPVYRDVLVDGQAPAVSFEEVKFAYNDDFENLTVTRADTGDAVGIWLSAGTHTVTLRVSLENLVFAITETEALIAEVQDLSMEVEKITGNNTEKYRDFTLDEYIPDLEERLLGWADRIDALYQGLKDMAGEKSHVGEFAVLEICSDQLRTFAEEPNELPRRLSELAQGESSVAQYLANTLEKLYSSPLSLDQIYVYQTGASLPGKINFFVRIWESIKRFFYSFTDDAYSVSATKDEAHLQVWVGRSRQYVEIIQIMADEAYENGELPVQVDVSLMADAGKLVLSNAAGETPDVALGVGYSQAFNLSIRGALKDLNEFEDIKEVESRFQSGLVYAGRYDNGLYALPETTNFYVLFYRKDILENLGLPAPDTMQDVKDMLPQLNRYGMNFFTHVAGYSGYKPFAATLPFLYQNGGSLYGETAQEITLDSEASIDALIEMTELFTVYGVPFEVRNFYQHFRAGTYTIGVADFNTYNLLLNTAPEIANSWDIALYPGYEDVNGDVQRWITGAAECGIIFDGTGNEDGSWAFLKWWTDASTQVSFAQTLQSTYGQEYLWPTANMEAFEKLPWNERHKAVILEQMDWIIEAPQVPSNYMMERELSNAVLAIVLDGENTRTAITDAVRNTRQETVRKLEEFGYMEDGEAVKPYIIPTLE
ncbi:MAG: extracellular solute-binding protein [Oscillospiraceae bacterium]|nr:extracellular solute-binding protein [Oscillospiraceae bacterium]